MICGKGWDHHCLDNGHSHILGEIGQYHGYWFHGSLCRQDISSRSIEYPAKKGLCPLICSISCFRAVSHQGGVSQGQHQGAAIQLQVTHGTQDATRPSRSPWPRLIQTTWAYWPHKENLIPVSFSWTYWPLGNATFILNQVVRSSYLHKGISFAGEMTSL